MSEFSHDVRVYIEDTDAGGIVYYVNYLKFYERARTEWFRTLGYNKPALLNETMMLVVYDANLRFHQSAKLDDLLCIKTKLVRLRKTGFVLEQRIYKEDALMAEASIVIACIDKNKHKPCAIPADIYQTLAYNVAS